MATPAQGDTLQRPMMMGWLPPLPDFRGHLRAALAVPPSAERLEKIAFLAQHRLGFLETIQLDRALGQLVMESASDLSHVRLAILGSSTVDHLVPAIRVAGLRRRMMIDVNVGAYGQYRAELLDSASSLYRFAPQMILFSLSARETIAGVSVAASAAEVETAIARSVDELRLLWRKV